ncbi:MAG: phenylalanine--tRNA ligase subunit alpha [DPANN group archaeon]|nr:phenylalanine--tRNA ligase subunit alpha [DPANN group archaeon]
MANLAKLADSLQDNDIYFLKALKKRRLASNLELQADTKLDQSAVARSALWLENKGLIEVKETKINVAILTKLGKRYLDEKLPERTLIEALAVGVTADKLIAKFMDAREFNAAIGYLRQKNAIIISKDKTELNEVGLSYKNKKTIEENFIEKFHSTDDFAIGELPPEDREALGRLKKRGLATEEVRTARVFTITDLGARVGDAITPGEKIGQLTPEIIKSCEWETKKFRRFDVEVRVPELLIGKKQAYVKFLGEVRDELVALGFEEITGPLVELSFFNNDALYMPQDHPARGIHDIYSVKEPKYGSLENYKHFLKEVKAAHETGGKAGSTGWQYQFNEKEAARLILRTQGTALSARTMISKNLKVPGAYFAVARVFRPEKLDATHLVEFNQTEGIVLDENANMKKLLGLLKDFAIKFTGAEKIKFVPAYFPFTEPSVELYAKHPQLGWVELGGAGIFRSEVVAPLLGRDVSVIAWGIGIDRIGMFRLGLSDVRDLFSRNLNTLRNAKVV